ncbi:YraN family protein [Streptomyces sp. NPDC005438]|uniref:YraN family protein n=1 Tax=Streptomyces sp. NPDC005438 TaxID=3156880 RepID=UPI0033B6A078
MSTYARGALGRYGEDLAAHRLHRLGMRILARNWRCGEGELDIIAAEDDALVVCEVKTRRGTRYQHPMASLTPLKAARIRRLSSRWLSECWLARYGSPPMGGVRIDLVGVVLRDGRGPEVYHAPGVA